MGKRLRLNRFITKWIKSDLPQDCSSVLLLGVTRIPTSPVPARRPCSLPLNSTNLHLPESPHLRRNSVSKRRTLVRKKSSLKKRDQDVPLRQPLTARVIDTGPDTPCSSGSATPTPGSTAATPPEPRNSDERTPEAVMDKSVDSIGSCSIDMEASVDTAEWSERSSTGTLLSASLLSSTPEPHLPSYLSLACTVNGYSTITNYDPVRLSKSRDASPQRPDTKNLTQPYTVLNNLLSPPNLVPLPSRAKVTGSNMTEQEFYSTATTIESYCSKEARFSSKFISKDSVDACYENTRNSINEKYISSFDSKVIKDVIQKQTYESNLTTETTKTQETKSFIQQRVERLYGPGALAQGFFVKKRQKSRLSESDAEKKVEGSNDHHSVSMSDKLLRDTTDDASCMKQSTSSPVLPVLRHLRPEFRAQLPIISHRKINEPGMQKSNTVPALKDEVKSNGHSKENGKTTDIEVIEILDDSIDEREEVKDGHHFIKVLEKEASRLLQMAEECEAELEKNDNLSEDAIGYIRSASGKAKLLVSQKMQQFKGLCTNNITQIEGEAFPTTNEDLQGFWDMVMLQVNQVDALFEDIAKLKQNDWKEVEPVKQNRSVLNGTKPKKIINRPVKSKVNTEEAQKQRMEREAERKRLIDERRKAMRAKCNQQQQNIEIFVAESS
ncbi:uncharacterized protein LOC123308239 [Coccinella septempunctata]|uniref:uncharacterized protein LOC123308239 n=1 Tax=Coccinella septempunctata TaxID=41139 RepID=UPI001D080764|nr:uncharacterized protein LOC123308239 [Coccinella septempunctata]